MKTSRRVLALGTVAALAAAPFGGWVVGAGSASRHGVSDAVDARPLSTTHQTIAIGPGFRHVAALPALLPSPQATSSGQGSPYNPPTTPPPPPPPPPPPAGPLNFSGD